MIERQLDESILCECHSFENKRWKVNEYYHIGFSHKHDDNQIQCALPSWKVGF